MITDVIFSSYFMKKRYHVKWTNFLPIRSILFPQQILIRTSICCNLYTIIVKLILCLYRLIFLFSLKYIIFYICLALFCIFEAGMVNYLYNVKSRKSFWNIKIINRQISFIQYAFLKLNILLHIVGHSISFTGLVKVHLFVIIMIIPVLCNMFIPKGLVVYR